MDRGTTTLSIKNYILCTLPLYSFVMLNVAIFYVMLNVIMMSVARPSAKEPAEECPKNESCKICWINIDKDPPPPIFLIVQATESPCRAGQVVWQVTLDRTDTQSN